MNTNILTADKINSAFIDQQALSWKSAAEEASLTAQAYLDDISKRKAALTEQADVFQKQLDQLITQRKALAAKINDLSSRGKIDDATKADLELEALDKSITTLERKLRLVNSAELKGDPELYQAAKSARDAMNAEYTPYRRNCSELIQIVEKEISRLESVKKDLWYAYDRNYSYHAERLFSKVDQHFHDLDRVKA